jgi:two-component system chemotaxis sensor kinase CheA
LTRLWDFPVRDMDLRTGMPDNGRVVEELRRQIDDLAMQAVMETKPAAPKALQALSDALAETGRRAAEAGLDEIARLAGDLSQAVKPNGGRSSAKDKQDKQDALRKGLAQLQTALESAAHAAASGAPPAPGGEAAPADAPAAPEAGAPAGDSTGTMLIQDLDLLGEVIMESGEHLTAVEAGLLTLEQDPSNHEAIHTTFRSFHTIKGLAGFMELHAIQQVAHETETVLDLARNGQLAINPAVIDVVLASKDYLQDAFRRLEPALKGAPPKAAPDNQALLARVRALSEAPHAPAEGAPAEPETPAAAAPAAPAAPVPDAPVPAASVEREPAPEAAEDSASQAKPEGKDEPAVSTQRSFGDAAMVKVDTSKLDFLVDMAGEMVIAQSQVSHDPDLRALESPRIQRNLAQLARITEELQKTAMAMRMVPVGQLFRRMPRLVRDLARKAGKQVELETAGEDTELDRTIVEALSDPFIHMIRNSLDHGVELPDERRAAGKDPVGHVRLKACHQAGHIMIEVSDDGRGIDRKKVLSKARQRGLVPDGAHLGDAEILNLIFEPGFSTADKITDVSGRGVGMDVVRKQLLKLRGRVEIQSELGVGTTFLLKLPLTLAIIDGLVVGVGQERYVVPLFAIREMFRPTTDMISTAGCTEGEMVLIRGRLLPFIRLYQRFQVKAKTEDPCQSVFLVAENGGKVFCLMVDEFAGKQEVVIKSLGETMKHIPGVAGGTILGDGRVALVLDLDGIFGRVHG